MTVGLMIDVVIIVLLLVTIGYAAVLARRLAALRAAKGEMAALLDDFNGATAQAERAMRAIDQDGRATAQALERLTAEARGVSDDLSFLLDRGNKLADRLSVGGGMAGHNAAGAAGGTGPDDASEAPKPASGARASLLKSIEGMR